MQEPTFTGVSVTFFDKQLKLHLQERKGALRRLPEPTKVGFASL